MAFAVNHTSDINAGGWIISALIVFSLARRLCSVSAKDVLGETVSKGKRGTLMDYSAGFAGIVTLVFGFYIERFTSNLAAM